eukprot:4010737-Lingulodinium_polyedra.AAC.1
MATCNSTVAHKRWRGRPRLPPERRKPSRALAGGAAAAGRGGWQRPLGRGSNRQTPARLLLPWAP